MTCRVNPFQPSKDLTEFLPFDPVKDSTYCEFNKSEQLYETIGAYIANQTEQSYHFTPKKNQSKATQILERLARIAKMEDGDEKQQSELDKTKDTVEKIKVNLGTGLHTFTHDNTKFYAIHQMIGDPVGGWSANPKIAKSLILFVQGRGKLDVLKKFANHVMSQHEAKNDSLFFTIYRFNVCDNYWKESGKKIARDLKTIILPTKTWQTLTQDFERFLDEKSIKWYFKHGIPYKRSYLFYGVPGSGKSSLIQALAAKYDRNLAFLQPSHPKMTDETFKDCIQSAPDNSLIVLEDIDALFNKDRSKKNMECPLTFSGLLNGLDGVGNPDGQIFILSTNYVDRLDSALIRSGRVDLSIEFPLATDEQLVKMFLLFYPNEEKLAESFKNEIRKHFGNGIAMAAVQQQFIQNMFVDAKIVIERVKDLGDRLDVVKAFDKSIKNEIVDEKVAADSD